MLMHRPENLTSLPSFQLTSPFPPIFSVRQMRQTHFHRDSFGANASWQAEWCGGGARCPGCNYCFYSWTLCSVPMTWADFFFLPVNIIGKCWHGSWGDKFLLCCTSSLIIAMRWENFSLALTFWRLLKHFIMLSCRRTYLCLLRLRQVKWTFKWL